MANANGKNCAINNNLNISWSGHKNELASRCLKAKYLQWRQNESQYADNKI